jgi:hypothetical protein
MKGFAVVIAVSVLASACGSMRKWRTDLEKEWLNRTREELVSKRGQPYAINKVDVKDTEIYIYHHTDFSPDIPPNDYYEDFFINKAGTIYKIETYRN